MTHLVIVEGITDKRVVQEATKSSKRINNPDKASRLIKTRPIIKTPRSNAVI